MKFIILFLFVISPGVCFADKCVFNITLKSPDSFKIDTSTIFSELPTSSKDIPKYIESLEQIYEGSQYSLEEKKLAIQSLQTIGEKFND